MTKIFAVLGGFFGVVIVALIMLIPELINLTVKSGGELKNIFRINCLGQIPDKDKIKSSAFFGAVNIMFNSFMSSTENIQSPAIAFCSPTDGGGKTFIVDNISDILLSKDKRILFIESIDEDEVEDDIEDFILNDFLYKKNMNYDDIVLNNLEENFDKAYFCLDDETYRSSLDKEKIIALINHFKQDYDYIFIELFEFLKNQQLFATFTLSVDQNIVVAGFRRTGKLPLKTMIDFIRLQNSLNITGVVNDIKKYYYKFIS